MRRQPPAAVQHAEAAQAAHNQPPTLPEDLDAAIEAMIAARPPRPEELAASQRAKELQAQAQRLRAAQEAEQQAIRQLDVTTLAAGQVDATRPAAVQQERQQQQHAVQQQQQQPAPHAAVDASAGTEELAAGRCASQQETAAKVGVSQRQAGPQQPAQANVSRQPQAAKKTKTPGRGLKGGPARGMPRASRDTETAPLQQQEQQSVRPQGGDGMLPEYGQPALHSAPRVQDCSMVSGADAGERQAAPTGAVQLDE